jgi:hypothetical protein
LVVFKTETGWYRGAFKAFAPDYRGRELFYFLLFVEVLGHEKSAIFKKGGGLWNLT